MPSFDIMSEPDMHEVRNASDQAIRELSQRFDFKGTNASIKTTTEGFELIANSEDRVKAVWEVLKDKFVKRKLSLKFIDTKDIIPGSNSTFKQPVILKKGIDKEHARSIVQMIKNQKNLKVTPSIQGETVRITSKKKDDLQDVISLLKTKEFPLELTFGNFRD
jgi:cyclic-di-GMP-binding protein